MTLKTPPPRTAHIAGPALSTTLAAPKAAGAGFRLRMRGGLAAFDFAEFPRGIGPGAPDGGGAVSHAHAHAFH